MNKLTEFKKGAHLQSKSVNLPGKHINLKLTLLFDLDETLAHSKEVKFVDGSTRYEILIRPHAKAVLKHLKKKYEIGLFTSSSKTYADDIIEVIDQSDTLFDFKLYNQDCIEISEGVFVKDLRILSKRELEAWFIVDNNLYCYGLQLGQGIPIIPYTGDQEDIELLKLQSYLDFLADWDSPLIYNNRYFGHDILLQQIQDSLSNLPNLMLERIVEMAVGNENNNATVK